MADTDSNNNNDAPSQGDKKPVVYLPGLPSLRSQDLPLYNDIHNERVNLVTQLDANGYNVEDIDSQKAWLKTMLRAAEQSDAFIFPPMTALPKDHPGFYKDVAQRWFEFFSVVTGVHVGNQEKYRSNGIAKPCIVVNTNNSWSSVIDLLKDLHDKGMFSSKVEDIVQVINGSQGAAHYHDLNKAAVEKLTELLKQEKGKPHTSVLAKYPADYHFEPVRKNVPRHPFGVTIFGSATTQEPVYKKFAFDIAKLSALRGWRLSTGAGVDGCMGAADEGFAEGKKEFNLRQPDARFKPAHIGVSTQPILRLEGPPQNLDQLIITENIYDRMKVMIKGQKSQNAITSARDATRVMYVCPGGTGTLHEFATLIQLVTNGTVMEGRKIVLCNPPTTPPNPLKPNEGFWDPLIKTAKEFGFDNLFEVARTPEEAIAIGDKVYSEWLETHPEYKDLYHPTLSPRPGISRII